MRSWCRAGPFHGAFHYLGQPEEGHRDSVIQQPVAAPPAGVARLQPQVAQKEVGVTWRIRGAQNRIPALSSPVLRVPNHSSGAGSAPGTLVPCNPGCAAPLKEAEVRCTPPPEGAGCC